MIHLITGVSGFVGRHLAHHLVKARPDDTVVGVANEPKGLNEVRYLKADLTDEAATVALVEDIRPDCIYHLAGAARVSAEIGMPEYFRSNFLTTQSLAAALAKSDRPVQVFLSSSVHVYGNQPSEVDEQTQPEPTGPYGYTKYLAEKALEQLTEQNPAIRVTVGRLNSCIGPGQAPGFVIADLVSKLAALPSSPAPDKPLRTGPLSAHRAFLDVRDAVKAFPALLERPEAKAFDIFNIASAVELKIRDVVERLVHISGRGCRIEAQEEQNTNPFRGTRVRVDKLKRTLPGLHFRPIDETLRDIWLKASAPS